MHGLVRVQCEYEAIAYGTGIVIGSQLVLTATHNIWDHSTRDAYLTENIQFYPGIDGKSMPFRAAKVKKVKKMFIPEGYIKLKKR